MSDDCNNGDQPMTDGGSEKEDEFEEILVHVEFDCEVDPGMFNAENTFKIIGIDSGNPLMQLGDKVFQGEWRDVIGTSVFFEEDEEKKKEMVHNDPLFSKNQSNPLKLAFHTRKSLLMSRVFVKPKNNDNEDGQQLEKDGEQSGKAGEQSANAAELHDTEENSTEINGSTKNSEKMDVT